MRVSGELRRQLNALLKRNLLLKRREPVQTVFEIIIPICIYVGVSFAINSLKPVKQTSLPVNTTIEYMPMELNFTGTYNRPGPVLVVVNTKHQTKRMQVFQMFKEILGSPAPVELVSGSSNPEIAARSLKRRYLYYRKKAIDKDNLPVGVVIDLDQLLQKEALSQNPLGGLGMDIGSMFGFYNYQIVLASPDLPPLPVSFLDTGPDSCLPSKINLPLTEVDPTKLSVSKCSALYYTTTGFLHLQNAVHRSILKVEVGMDNKEVSNVLKWQLMPRTTASDSLLMKTGDDMTSTFGSFTVYLAGIAVINLFSALVAGAVTEKEKGVKETMLLMGMNGLMWKMSWFIVYFVEVIIVSGLSTLVSWLQNLMSGPAAGIFFILLFTYGFSLVSFGLLMISFFKTARGAATATSFVFVVLGLPYIIVQIATMFSKKSVPMVAYYMLSFLFPFAFQRGMYLLLESDRIAKEGAPVDVSVWGMILMLILDGFLYLLLGLMSDYLPGIISDYKLAHGVRKAGRVASDSNNSSSEDDEISRNIEFDPSLENRRAIVINNLTKTFNRRNVTLPGQEKPLTAVDNLSLTIYGGQITCLLGHNGAGKTTLIRILTGSLKSYEGTVHIFNWQVESMRDIEQLRRDIGVCAQQNTLFDSLTCAEHLSFVLELKSDLPADSRDAIVSETMALVSLTDRANTNAARLSGGEKRKLCLAMAIIAKPKLLFLDEPTAGVDVYCRRQIWDVLTQYKQADRVVLLTTHYMDEADMLSDRKALMHRGRLYSAGSSMFLRQRFGCGYRLTVELDPNQADEAKIEEITGALRSVMPSIVPMESERSRSELAYALPTGEENMGELLALLRFLESDQTQLARYGVLCYGWSIATLDEVFMKLEEEVAELESEQENNSNKNAKKPSEKSVFFFKKLTSREPVLEVAEVIQPPANKGTPVEPVNNNGKNGGVAKTSHIPPPISFSGIDVPEESPNSLRRHYVAIVFLRLMQSLRNIKIIVMRFFFPIIIAILGLTMSRMLLTRFLSSLVGSSEASGVNKTSLFVYQPFIYANVSSALTVKLKETMMEKLNADESSELVNKIGSFSDNNGPFLLIKNYTQNTTNAQLIGGFIDMMTSSFMSTTAASDSSQRPLMEVIEMYGSKIGAYFDIGDNGIKEEKLLFSHTAIHALPSLLAYAHSLDAAKEGFIPIFLPFLQSFSSASRELVIQAYTSNFIFTMLFATHVLTMLPSLGFDVVRDHETGCATQIKLAGISKISYWLGSFTIDALEYAVFLLVFLLFASVFDVYSLSFAGARYAFLLYILLVVPANVLMIYCLTLFFKTFRVFSSVVTMLVSMTGFFPFLAVFFWSISFIVPTSGSGISTPTSNLRFNPDWQYLLSVLCFLFPPFNASAGVFLIAFVSQPNIATCELPTPEVSDFFSDQILRYLWSGSIIHICLFGSIIFIFENRGKISRMLGIKGGLYSLFRKQAYLKSANFATYGNCSDGRHRPEEDDDVIAERRDVYDLAASPVQGGDLAPYVCEARKIYTTLCRDCKPVEPKCAVEDCSFKLNYGQVFGLLGPNGAGKTTLIKLIIGSENPTSGSIFSRGSTALGYCPQESVLWDQLSGEEHVFIYAYSRGFSKKQRDELTRRLGNGLGIWGHLKKQTRRMSGGTKRKLNVALSLLGRPSVLCLDEPSAGMDPSSKRFLWRVIKQIFAAQNSDWKIAALLTTHHLDEAEALCHRIAIMVNGALRCIGSRQHLKTKYGRYYTLEIKVGNDQLMMDAGGTGLIDFIDKLLPEAMPSSLPGHYEAPQLINNFGRHFVFRIPSTRIRSLAKIFSDLENAKANGSFSSYSFSQVSLEQIFIQFAKEQYED